MTVQVTAPQSKELTECVTRVSDQVISLYDYQTFCVRAGDVKTVKPESIVTGAHGSWKSTVN